MYSIFITIIVCSFMERVDPVCLTILLCSPYYVLLQMILHMNLL